MPDITRFIERLANFSVDHQVVTNHYEYGCPENEFRRNNLMIYLRTLKDLKPKVLLIGEAPGYKGCRVSGIPFTSENIMMNGITNCGVFGEHRGYQNINEKFNYEKEQSSTIVWGELASLNLYPLIWNAYPFHPHNREDKKSNRAPLASEITQGSEFLTELIEIFEIKYLGLVGKSAKRVSKHIKNLSEIQTLELRHPAYGGKAKFSEGLLVLSKES